jgi:hypothetical protein
MSRHTRLPLRVKLLAGVAASLGAMLLLIVLAIGGRGGAVEAVSPRVADVEVPDESISQPELAPREIQEVAKVPEEPDATASTPDDEASQPESEVFGPRLITALEATLDGDVDPCAFLDAALELSKLEVDPRAIPEASPSGEIRYPLLGTPQGVSAELWIRRSNNPNHDPTVLTYAMKFDRPSDSYTLAGAARHGPEAQITIWRDREGKLSYFGVLTNFYLWRTRPEGRIPLGSLYALDVSKPFEVKGSVSAMTPTGIAEDRDALRLVGCPWPRMDDLERLKSGMLAMHAKLQR